MKSLSFFKYLFLLAVAVVLMPACGEDDGLGGGTGGGGTTTAPFVDFIADTDVISSDATLTPGATFSVRLNALPGEADLKTLTIYEDGFSLDPSRFTITGISPTNNPQLVTGDDVTGFTWDITVTAQSDMSTLSYEFEVADQNDVTTSATINITTEEDVITEPVTITFNNSDPIDAVAEQLMGVNLMVAGNGNTLNTLAVYEDGTLINDLTRLRYKDVTADFTMNPQAFAEGDMASFDGIIYVRAIEGSHNLTFEVETTSGETFSSVIAYNTAPIGTPISGTFQAVLLVNSAGPNPTGGLDLDVLSTTGIVDDATVSVNSGNADIVDLGINLDNGDWLQGVKPSNGATLKLVTEPLETYTFTSVVTKEAIAAGFNSGSEVASDSGTLEEGQLLTVLSNDGTIFLLEVSEINFTSSNNDDYYRFNVKY